MKQININDFIIKNDLNITERLEVLGMEFIKNGDKYIIRFKSQGREDRKIKHKDVIKGNLEFPEIIQI